MSWYAWLFLGIITGLVLMYILMRPNLGNKYEIEADIKNKKGEMTDNIFKGEINENKPKKRLFKKPIFKTKK